MEMRWRQKDIKKLSSYVRKFNTSITKLSQRYPEIADAGLLPSRLNVKEIRDSELSRRDFNRLMAQVDRWFNPKSREIVTKRGIKMTRWEYQNALNNAQAVSYNRKSRRDRAVRSSRQQQQVGGDKWVGDKLDDLQKRIHVDDISEFTPEDARMAWKAFTATLEKQSKDEYFREQSLRYYDNYHTAIYENFSDDNARTLANFIEDFRLSGDELFDLIGKYPHLDIDYMYGPEEEDNKLELIMESFPRAVSDVLGKDRALQGLERLRKRVGETPYNDYIRMMGEF